MKRIAPVILLFSLVLACQRHKAVPGVTQKGPLLTLDATALGLSKDAQKRLAALPKIRHEDQCTFVDVNLSKETRFAISVVRTIAYEGDATHLVSLSVGAIKSQCRLALKLTRRGRYMKMGTITRASAHLSFQYTCPSVRGGFFLNLRSDSRIIADHLQCTYKSEAFLKPSKPSEPKAK